MVAQTRVTLKGYFNTNDRPTESNFSDFIDSAFNLTDGDTGNSIPVTASGGTTSRLLAERFADIVNVKDFGALGNGVANDRAAIQLAINKANASGGGIIFFPRGEYLVSTSSVAQDEGTCFNLVSGGNIRFLGCGSNASVVKPASNKLEIFAQNGASNLIFHSLGFDNSDNGILQNQTKPGTYTVDGGIVGLGNGANAAIRQYGGSNLTVLDCLFTGWNTCVHYIGDNSDNSILTGDLVVDNVEFDDFCFGILVHQPEHFRATNIRGSGNTPSVNASPPDDPGHEVYVTDRSGAHPKTVVINGVQAEDGDSYALQIRKGEAVAITNIATVNMQRGIDFENCKRLVVSNAAIHIVSGDSNGDGIRIIDCGNCEVTNLYIDLRGADAFGVNINSNLESETWNNIYGAIRNLTIINDFSGGTGKAPIILSGQSDWCIDRPRFIHTGTTQNTRSMVDVRGSTAIRIIRPILQTPDNVAWPRLVQLDSLCSGCSIEWSNSDMDIAADFNTIINSGAATSIYQAGFELSRGVVISNGAMTAGGAYTRVDTSGAVSSDDLDTINGGVVGQLLILRATADNRTVVVKDGTGNLNLAGDFSLDNTSDRITLLKEGSDWYEISRSDNAA